MIIRTKVDGSMATVVFLTADLKPAEQDDAEQIKVIWDDGRIGFARAKQQTQDAGPWEESKHKRVAKGGHGGGQFTSGGGGGGSSEQAGQEKGQEQQQTQQEPGVFASIFGSKNPLMKTALARHAQKQQAEEQSRQAKEQFSSTVEAVSSQMGFPKNKIKFDTQAGEKFELNGKAFRTLAHADMDTGEVVLHSNELAGKSPETVSGIVAHEVTHQQYQTALDAYEQGRKAVKAGKDPNEAYTRLNRFMSDYDTAQRLEADDGCTDYSASYWKAYARGRATREDATHETLAEISRLKQLGQDKDVSPLWKQYHAAVSDIYRSSAKESGGSSGGASRPMGEVSSVNSIVGGKSIPSLSKIRSTLAKDKFGLARYILAPGTGLNKNVWLAPGSKIVHGQMMQILGVEDDERSVFTGVIRESDIPTIEKQKGLLNWIWNRHIFARENYPEETQNGTYISEDLSLTNPDFGGTPGATEKERSIGLREFHGDKQIKGKSKND